MSVRVVKIGGSLEGSEELKKLLSYLLAEGKEKTVLVPGGGSFANNVRKLQTSAGFSDKYAHRMALLAMEQYAWYLRALTPELQTADSLNSIFDSLTDNDLTLWLPYKMLCSESTLPASWDVTSDSLAAWLALKIEADSLTLVKSAALPESYSGWTELARLGLVDVHIENLLKQTDLSVYWLQKDEYVSIFSPSSKSLIVQR